MKKPRQTLKEGDKENSKDKRHFKRVSEPVGLGILLRRSLFSGDENESGAVFFFSNATPPTRRGDHRPRPPAGPTATAVKYVWITKYEMWEEGNCKFAIRVDGQIRSALHSHPMSRGSGSDGGGSAKTPLQHFSTHFCSNSPHFEVVDNVCLIELLCKSQRLPRRAQDEEITIWARHSGFPRTTLSQCEHMWHRQRQTTW